MERTDELKERIRQQPLNDRLEESRRRIGDMCSKGLCPKMTIPVQHDDDDFYINTTLADAQATIAALQARVQELEDGTSALLNQQSERLAVENEKLMMALSQLTQRTAELEAAKGKLDIILRVSRGEPDDELAVDYGGLGWENDPAVLGVYNLTAELERVRGELDHAKKMEAVQKEVADNQAWHVQKLRALILALPKVEGEITVSESLVLAEDPDMCSDMSDKDEAVAYAALLTHRQGMEG